MSNTTSHGAYLSILIEERGWSQERLARFLGVSRPTIKSILAGAMPKQDLAMFIERLYDSGFTYGRLAEQAMSIRALELKAKWLKYSGLQSKGRKDE